MFFDGVHFADTRIVDHDIHLTEGFYRFLKHTLAHRVSIVADNAINALTVFRHLRHGLINFFLIARRDHDVRAFLKIELAMARPITLVAPVTMAVWPSSIFAFISDPLQN